MVRRLFTFVSCRSGANFQLRVIFKHHSQDQGRHYFPSSYTSRLGPNFSLGLVLHATTSIISQRALLCYDIHPPLVLEFTTSVVYWPFGPFFCSGRPVALSANEILRNLCFVFSRSAGLNGPLHSWHLGLWIRTYGTLSTRWATVLRLA